jgi:hypothetical protein
MRFSCGDDITRGYSLCKKQRNGWWGDPVVFMHQEMGIRSPYKTVVSKSIQAVGTSMNLKSSTGTIFTGLKVSMRGKRHEIILQAKHHVGDTCNDLGTKASWLEE